MIKIYKSLKEKQEDKLRRQQSSHVNRQGRPIITRILPDLNDPATQSAKELQLAIRSLYNLKQNMVTDDWGQGYNVGVQTCIRTLKTRLVRLK